MHDRKKEWTFAQLQGLAQILRARALPALESLTFSPAHWGPGMVPLLTGALASGACPSLRTLDIGDHKFQELVALATMLEARAALPACRDLEMLLAERFWGWGNSEAACCRLLRAMLPWVTELNLMFEWNAAYGAEFVALRPPRLKAFSVYNDETPPVEVYEAIPALESLNFCSHIRCEKDDDSPPDAPRIEPIVSALNRGVAFQRLQKLDFSEIFLGGR